MPYTESELETNEFYQEFARRDEKEYKEKRDVFLNNWSVGLLRDNNGTIILFEEIVDGEGSIGNSYVHPSQKINIESYITIGYFDYDKTEPQLDNLIDREFSEL
tara:strand:+ start:179 stop:490 length:312 start_codon:yes stop_codon:yes gene_type:complete